MPALPWWTVTLNCCIWSGISHSNKKATRGCREEWGWHTAAGPVVLLYPWAPADLIFCTKPLTCGHLASQLPDTLGISPSPESLSHKTHIRISNPEHDGIRRWGISGRPQEPAHPFTTQACSEEASAVIQDRGFYQTPNLSAPSSWTMKPA